MTCDFNDLEATAEISKYLLSALCGYSMKKHPRSISEPKINLIKNALMNALGLKGRPLGEERSGEKRREEGIGKERRGDNVAEKRQGRKMRGNEDEEKRGGRWRGENILEDQM